LVAVAAAACGPAPTPTPPSHTEIAILPTPWAGGTTGQFGLRIDPSLLARLPRTIDAYPLVENTLVEGAALDDQDLARQLETYAAAAIGEPGDDNWLSLELVRFKSDLRSPSVWPDTYETWVGQYAADACSAASDVATTNQETINDWLVDEATCGGGQVVYTLSLGDGEVLSMTGDGPRELGRKLLNSLYQ
jgi:hypothetical protein